MQLFVSALKRSLDCLKSLDTEMPCQTCRTRSAVGITSKESPFLFLHVGKSGRCRVVCKAREKGYPEEHRPLPLGTG